MIKEFLEAGQIVGTHGVRGMVRIMPWSDDGEFLSNFKKFYLENGESLAVTKIQPHGRVVIAAFKGVDTVEQAEALRGKTVCIARKDAKLGEGRYFVSELIGCTVFDADTNALLGTLTDVSETGANDVWHITRDNNEYLVPAIPDVIVSVDVAAEKIVLRPLKGIFEDEN